VAAHDFAQEPPLIDAVGVAHESSRAAPRIVSLVPSLTELLCDLGLRNELVGRTGFCVHPREVVRTIPKVGGTKSVNLARLRELAPTHIIVNIDENEKPTVEEIARFVPHVIVTHPVHPRENVHLYGLLGGIFRREAEAAALVDRFEKAWRETTRATSAFARENVLYLIWKEPWMSVARSTYISAMLGAVGWDTVPQAAVARYPKIELEEVLAEDVRHVLLSTEPYCFRQRDVVELRDVLPPHVTVDLIDAEMTSWYGSRAIAGLPYLADLRRRLSVAAS
jgi:ABC-type Fe3+-hydroxamate transport system substrate-binding protein